MAQTYKYTIEGNTQPAVDSNEALDKSINQVDNSTKQLSTDLNKTSLEANKAFSTELENKIKANDAQIKKISGTVGLLTGTLSTVVGTLGLFGIDDEQVESFQKATLSVLALGSGAAQAITGIKDLTESRKILTELNNASTVAENSNTTALVTNAAAAESVTIAQNAAAVSITSEKTATDANTVSKGLNTAATGKEIVATEGLTLAKRAQLLIEQALQKARQLSIGGWIAIGVAIFTAAKFIYDWTQASKGEEKQLKSTIELRKEELQLLKDTNRQYLNAEAQLKQLQAGAKARGRSITEEAAAEKQRAQDAIKRYNAEITLLRDGVAAGRVTQEQVKDQIESQKILRGEAEKYYNQVVAAETLYQSQLEESNKKSSERNKQLRNERLEREGIVQLIQLEIDEVKNSILFAPAREGSLLDVRNLKSVEESLNSIKNILVEIDDTELEEFTFLSREQLDILKRLRGELDTELQQQLFAREQQYKDELALFVNNEEAKKRLTEEYEQDKVKIRRQYAIQTARDVIGITSGFLNTIAEINQASLELQLAQAAGNQAAIDKINADALEKQKKLRIAQTLVTTAESILNGFNVTSTLPPPFNFIAGGILAAAYGALGAKTIQTINSTTLEGGGSAGGFNNIPGGGAAFGSINLGGAAAPNAPFPTGILPGVGGGRLGGPTGVGEAQMPIRAYVLAGDVENGVQANLALNNRRRLAG